MGKGLQLAKTQYCPLLSCNLTTYISRCSVTDYWVLDYPSSVYRSAVMASWQMSGAVGSYFLLLLLSRLQIKLRYHSEMDTFKLKTSPLLWYSHYILLVVSETGFSSKTIAMALNYFIFPYSQKNTTLNVLMVSLVVTFLVGIKSCWSFLH